MAGTSAEERAFAVFWALSVGGGSEFKAKQDSQTTTAWSFLAFAVWALSFFCDSKGC